MVLNGRWKPRAQQFEADPRLSSDRSSLLYGARVTRAAVLHRAMRDEHRPKQELIHEIAGLRKQVVDLKEAMTARRRVENALRSAHEMLRALTDDAPIGLCLFRRDGTLLAANRTFARLLGYDSPAELQAVGGVLGFFATPEERSRALNRTRGMETWMEQALFRTKEGCRRAHTMIAADCAEQQGIVVVVFDQANAGANSFREENG
jgi:PAS domain S-box-containing protein